MHRTARPSAVLVLLSLLLAGVVGLVAPGPASAAPASAHRARTADQRVVAVARRYAGHARYRSGGDSPRTGFDCSGFTEYVYASAHVARLPHNAEAQRHVRGMHRISRHAARPGDLIFYFDGGGPAFHVAIFAGHDMQYAATTPGEGVRHQRIWSHDIEFMTMTH